jgi:hypothetical protein
MFFENSILFPFTNLLLFEERIIIFEIFNISESNNIIGVANWQGSNRSSSSSSRVYSI